MTHMSSTGKVDGSIAYNDEATNPTREKDGNRAKRGIQVETRANMIQKR